MLHNGACYLNTAGVIRWIYELDLEDVNDARQAKRIHGAQQRARAAVAAEAIKPAPRTLDEVLWDVFRGNKVRALFQQHQIDAAFDVLLDPPSLDN